MIIKKGGHRAKLCSAHNGNVKNLFVLLSILVLLFIRGCSAEVEAVAEVENAVEVEDAVDIYGVWYLERVVLRSNMYSDDIEKNGEIIPVDVGDYLGWEIEYAPDFFRIGDKIYDNPSYTFDEVSVDDIEIGGKFRLTDNFPGVIEFLIKENVELDSSDAYDYLGDVLLLHYDISFEPYQHIPVGSRGIMLNHDMMLIGTWGKIILAHRVQE